MAMYVSAKGRRQLSRPPKRKKLKMEILESQNKEYGFYGTTALYSKATVKSQWEAAFRWVAKVMPTWSAEDIRGFLDGRAGRHLADEVRGLNGNWELVLPERWLRSMYEFAVEVGIADKTPGLDLRLEADKELRKAVSSLRNTEKLYARILQRLPDEKSDTAYTHSLREYAEDRLAEIRTFLNNL